MKLRNMFFLGCEAPSAQIKQNIEDGVDYVLVIGFCLFDVTTAEAQLNVWHGWRNGVDNTTY